MTMSEPLLRASTVARRLGWTLQRLYRLAAQKRIPHVRVGREVFFEAAEVEAWLEAHRVRPVSKGTPDGQRIVERARLGIGSEHVFS